MKFHRFLTAAWIRRVRAHSSGMTKHPKCPRGHLAKLIVDIATGEVERFERNLAGEMTISAAATWSASVTWRPYSVPGTPHVRNLPLHSDVLGCPAVRCSAASTAPGNEHHALGPEALLKLVEHLGDRPGIAPIAIKDVVYDRPAIDHDKADQHRGAEGHRFQEGGPHLSIRPEPRLDQGPQSHQHRRAAGEEREVEHVISNAWPPHGQCSPRSLRSLLSASHRLPCASRPTDRRL
jgi:hypothetical protein